VEAFTANDARIHLGDILLKSQKMPVQITRSGKPVAVVVSMEDYQTFEQLKMQALQARVKEAEEDEAAGHVADGETFMRDLIDGKFD
jgi:prevent-host-death family protein